MKDGPVGVVARLKAAREQAGLSQGQVAKLMGIHRPTVSEIEAGRRRVQLDELTQFAKIYRVSVNWLTQEADGEDDLRNAKVQLAARELGKLKQDDLDRVLNLLKSLRFDEQKKGNKR